MTKNFRREEFACKCGCGYDRISPKVVEMAQTIRDVIGVPIRVTSGCRCKGHNFRVGGTSKSKHLLGLAADITCSKGAQVLFDLIHILKKNGRLPDLDYCILYQSRNFIHIDCGGKRDKLYEVRP